MGKSSKTIQKHFDDTMIQICNICNLQYISLFFQLHKYWNISYSILTNTIIPIPKEIQMFLSCKSYCFFIRNLILSQSSDVEGSRFARYHAMTGAEATRSWRQEEACYYEECCFQSCLGVKIYLDCPDHNLNICQRTMCRHLLILPLI